MNEAEKAQAAAVEKEFRDSLLIDPATELEDLRKTAQQFYIEAAKKLSIQAKVIVAERKAADRKNFLYLDMREKKEAGDKSLTEVVIATTITHDKLYQSLDRDVDTFKLAEVRQSHKLEALRMKHSALKVLVETARTEMMLSGGTN